MSKIFMVICVRDRLQATLLKELDSGISRLFLDNQRQFANLQKVGDFNLCFLTFLMPIYSIDEKNTRLEKATMLMKIAIL